VARGHWSGAWLRAALREAEPAVTGGQFGPVLHSAASVLECAGGDQEHGMLLALRQLVDAIAPAP
jgi:hypothetical protein